jgi:hypothetical protein
MKGILTYCEADPTFVNSVTGWFIHTDQPSLSYTVSDDSIYLIKKNLLKSGDEVEYELQTRCYIDEQNRSLHSIVARIVSNEEIKSRIFLIDIDGTICDDIKNEESHLYPTAQVFPNAKEIINKWYSEGHIITFFTAREEKDREVTQDWLKTNGFNYHGLVMDKPRIQDGQEYVWIDNRKVRAVTYMGTWSELKEVDARIKVFG